MQMSPRPLGKRIGELRRALGLTQRQFAMRLGRSAGWVAKIEAGERYPSLQVLAILAEALETSPEDLVDYTDWNGSGNQAPGRRREGRRSLCRAFAQAAGLFSLPPRPSRRKRRALYADFSKTALEMVRRLRRRRDLNWREILGLPVTNAGEAGFVVHVLDRARCRVVRLRPLDLGLRLMICAGTTLRTYSGDRHHWCIRTRFQGLDLVVIPQVSFLGRSGAAYRADFVVGAVQDGRVLWVDVEIDEYAHTLQRQQDAERDADIPIETIRIPEERLVEPGLLDDLVDILRQRLAGQGARDVRVA